MLEHIILLDDERLPNCRAIQAELKAAGLGYRLYRVTDLREHSGFWPVDLKGEEVGFEWSYGLVEEILDDRPKGIGDRTHAAILVTSGPCDLTTALYVAAAIAKLADGLVWNMDSEKFVDAVRAWKYAVSTERSLKSSNEKSAQKRDRRG